MLTIDLPLFDVQPATEPAPSQALTMAHLLRWPLVAAHRLTARDRQTDLSMRYAWLWATGGRLALFAGDRSAIGQVTLDARGDLPLMGLSRPHLTALAKAAKAASGEVFLTHAGGPNPTLTLSVEGLDDATVPAIVPSGRERDLLAHLLQLITGAQAEAHTLGGLPGGHVGINPLILAKFECDVTTPARCWFSGLWSKIYVEVGGQDEPQLCGVLMPVRLGGTGKEPAMSTVGLP